MIWPGPGLCLGKHLTSSPQKKKKAENWLKLRGKKQMKELQIIPLQLSVCQAWRKGHENEQGPISPLSLSPKAEIQDDKFYISQTEQSEEAVQSKFETLLLLLLSRFSRVWRLVTPFVAVFFFFLRGAKKLKWLAISSQAHLADDEIEAKRLIDLQCSPFVLLYRCVCVICVHIYIFACIYIHNS